MTLSSSKFSIRIVFILLFCSCSSELVAQKDSIGVSNNTEVFLNRYSPDSLISKLDENDLSLSWRKIVIVDQLYPEYLNTYSFIQSKRKVTVLDSLNQKIGRIKKAQFNDLISKLVHHMHISDSLVTRGVRMRDPLTQFGLDSNWYKSHIVELWDDYRITNAIELNATELEKSKAALLHIKSVHRNIKFPNNWNVKKQPVVDVKIMYDFDTLRIQATSYFPYMLSWYYFNNKTRLADSEISVLIYEMLRSAKIESENTIRLSGVNFEACLIDDLYKRYLLTGVLKETD